MLLAKPNGITLEEHTRHVREEAARLLDARPFSEQKYARLTQKNLRECLDFCALWHDAGKEHPKWQAACQADYALWKANPHAKLFHLRKSGIRHEMDSLVRLKKSGQSHTKSDLVAIAAHHSKLSHRAENRWTDDPAFVTFWKDFQGWNSEFRLFDPASFEAVVFKRYLYDGPRALLQLADHRASALEEGGKVPKLEPFRYQFPHKDPQTGEPSYRGVQKIVRELWDEPLAILRAPTGAGKTDAALLWAKHQIEKGRADRLIIAMPTRFTSNALSISAAENLSQVGLYHSTSYFKRKRDAEAKNRWNPDEVKKENELARQIQTPVTVTTLDHLCIALTGAREDHHAIFWGMAQSCVVIDEADFYDEFTQYNLVKLLQALRVLDVRVLVMSATVPNSSLPLYSQSGWKVEHVWGDTPPAHWSEAEKQEMEQQRVRPRCVVHFDHKVEIPEDIADLLQQAVEGKPTIIYANTVKRAQAYVKWFEAKEFRAKKAGEDETEKVFVLYHSRFTEPDKARKEELLIEMFGADAWDKDKPGEPHGVAILTQIGELSVNISADTMISDLCPIDRLAQRAGRLARFGSQIGELHVVIPVLRDKEDQISVYPAPYGEYKNNHGWQPSAPFEASQKWLSNGQKSAQDWIDGVNCVYSEMQNPSHETRHNQRELEKLLIANWLIVQKAEIEADDDQTKNWQSRNIPPQQEVFIHEGNVSVMNGEDDLFFSSWGAFREWKSQHVIGVRSYEVKTAVDNRMLESVSVPVGEDIEKIFVAKPDCYSFERGLILMPQQNDAEDEGYG